MKPILKYSLINSLETAIYVIAVASFMYYAQIERAESNITVFIPIAMLLLFVFSAAFTSILVFGRPVMWYLDGKKKDALSLLAHTH